MAIKVKKTSVRMTLSEMTVELAKFKDSNPEKNAVIVFKNKQEAWEGKSYPLASRSYLVGSSDKWFDGTKLGSGLHGDSLDCTDRMVRLDWYIKRPKFPWKVDYCYLCDIVDR